LGEIGDGFDVFRITLPEQDALLTFAEIDKDRQPVQFLFGKIKIVLVVVILKQMANANMTRAPAQTLNPAHAAEICKKGDNAGGLFVEKGKGLSEKQIVAAGEQKPA